jgi:polysaccharide deacetylase family protein (PEP-CTERM system associated)
MTGFGTVERESSREGAAGVGVAAPEPAERAATPFLLSIDFEDWHQLVHRRLGRPDWEDGSASFVHHVSTLLDLLEELDVSATFFVAGMTADRHPGALAAVASRGHELACHGYEHRRASRQTPDEFRRDVVRSLDAIERICGVRPVGYRAPWFSITRDSLWVPEILRELGFAYDSSLYDSFRIPNRIRPIPAAPWRLGAGDDALWEFPIAVWRRERIAVPLGGAAYWRALPGAVLWRGLEQVSRHSTFPVLYFHPYEFAREPLRAVPRTPSSVRERARETWRSVSKNTRRHLIALRLREAATRFQLLPFRAVLGAPHDDLHETLLRQTRARV